MRPVERIRSHGRERGLSVIEVLIATLIVSLGLAGTLAIHGRAFVGSDSAGYRLQASWLASNLIERMRTNFGEDYAIALGSITNGDGQAGRDLTVWKRQLARALPAGDGGVYVARIDDSVTGAAVLHVQVTVRWDDRRASGDRATLGDPIWRHVSAEAYLPLP